MKRFFISAGVLVIGGIAIWNLSLNTGNTPVFVNFSMTEIEAFSGCETSSIPSMNGGYCTQKYNSTVEVCVKTGNGGEPRCSGNTN
jgi:hypothetical protein